MTSDRLDGAHLRAVRERLGFTAEALSAVLGVRTDTIRKWEAGREPIPVRVRAEVEQIETVTDEVYARLVELPEIPVWASDHQMTQAGSEHARYGARWWRHVAADAARDSGARIVTAPSDPIMGAVVGS